MNHIGPEPFRTNDLPAIRYHGEIYREHHGGELPENRNWDYLRERWELDKPRFDHYHPLLGRWLTEDWHLRHEPMPPVVTTSAPPPVVIVPPPVNHLDATPEPSSWVLLAVGVLLAWVWRQCR